MRTNRHLDNNRGATMFESAVGVVLLLFSILAGIDLVRLAYTTAIIQYEVVRGTRLANIEANSPGTGFGAATYKSDLSNNCSSGIYSACGTPVAACTPVSRVCGLRNFIRDNIVMRALAGELSPTTESTWRDFFTISSVAPGGIEANFVDNNAGNPGDLLIVDLNINVQLVSPLRMVIGDTVPIRASSVGKNEF